MKRTGPLALVAGALITTASLIQAQETPPSVPLVPQSPVLTVDQERLFSGSRVAERVSAEIERRTQELATENRTIEAKLTAEELDLTERRATLAPAEFRALADAFDAQVQRIRQEQDEKARDLQRLQEQEQQDFLRRITPIMAEIVRERRAVVVMDRRAVFLSADSIDITDEAISRINATLDAEGLEVDGTDTGAETPTPVEAAPEDAAPEDVAPDAPAPVDPAPSDPVETAPAEPDALPPAQP